MKEKWGFVLPAESNRYAILSPVTPGTRLPSAFPLLLDVEAGKAFVLLAYCCFLSPLAK